MFASELAEIVDGAPHGWEHLDVEVRPYGFMDAIGNLDRRDEALAEAARVLAPLGGRLAGGVVRLTVVPEPTWSNSSRAVEFALRRLDAQRISGDVYEAVAA
jgi:hypothetical protein